LTCAISPWPLWATVMTTGTELSSSRGTGRPQTQPRGRLFPHPPPGIVVFVIPPCVP
jgi:hypothetical protein